MAVTLNKANLVLKDANGNIGKIEQLSSNDLAKIKTAVSDVALVVNQSNHTPIEATTTNKGVVQLATSADVVSGASDKVVTAEQLHNATTGTSALATENLARIDAVVTEAGIPIDHTNTNQLKTAVTTLVNNAVPSTATSTTLGVVKPDNDTITIDSNGVLTATAQMPGVATTTNVGVVKPDGTTITVDGNGTLTATAQIPGVATTSTVGVVKPDGSTITVDGDGTLTWVSKNFVRSVNGINADSQGNVTINAISLEGEWHDNNGNFWRVYSDGWCEQGGWVNAIQDSLTTVNLLHYFKDASYNISTEVRTSDSIGSYSASVDTWSNVQSITTTSFKVNMYESPATVAHHVFLGFYWRACGYIR